MTGYVVVFSPRAAADLSNLTSYIAGEAGLDTAERFAAQILHHLEGFSHFPHRGTLLQSGRRRIGFRRRLTIVIRVRGRRVTILTIAYRGRDVLKEIP